MNERIKELAKQAEALVESMPIEERWDWLNLYDQKFAELIVKECASVGEQNHTWTAGMVANEIKDRFGVE